MALIVEDGTGKSTAEAYCSTAQADTYHAVRTAGESWTDLDTDVKERALREATDYLTQTYTGRWGGVRSTDAQALDWPRLSVPWEDSQTGYRPDNTIPSELVKASAELAFRASTSPLVVDLGRETASERVDVISVTYVQGADRQAQYEVVEMWLKPLLVGGGENSIMVARA
jgi:hypothetical protein